MPLEHGRAPPGCVERGRGHSECAERSEIRIEQGQPTLRVDDAEFTEWLGEPAAAWIAHRPQGLQLGGTSLGDVLPDTPYEGTPRERVLASAGSVPCEVPLGGDR